MKHTFLTPLLILLATLAANAASPNIIYIRADDMGCGDVSSTFKEGKIPTPNIDRLATEGMMFTDAHTYIKNLSMKHCMFIQSRVIK